MEKDKTVNSTDKRLASITDHDKAALTCVMYNLVFCNEVGIQAVFDLMNELEQTRYYHHGVKRWTGIVRQHMRAYNTKLGKKVDGYIDFIADLNDTYCEQLNDDLWRLRNVAAMRLNKEHISEAELKANVYVALTLIMAACHNNDHSMDGFPHLKIFGKRFTWMRPTDISGAFTMLCKELEKELKDDFTEMLNNDNNVRNGFRVIAYKLHNGDNILDTCERFSKQWQEENNFNPE